MVLAWNDPELPWFGVFLGGLWFANLFYWGCNQYITQRVLAARSLAEGQRGVLFAAGLKLFTPLIIVIPGIIAYALYGARVGRADQAYPFLITAIVPTGLAGLIFAGLLAAVIRSLSSMLNSSATIFTMDLYRRYAAAGRAARERALIGVGRGRAFGILVLPAGGALGPPRVSRTGRILSFLPELFGSIKP